MLKREDLKDGVKLQWPDEEIISESYATVQVSGDQVQLLVTDSMGFAHALGYDTFDNYLAHLNSNGVQLAGEQHAD